MHGEVGVALAEPDLGVLQSAEDGLGSVLVLLDLPARQRAQGLGQQGERFDPHGHFAGAGAEEPPHGAHVIVEVELLHDRPALAQCVLAEVELDPPRGVLDVTERRLALRPPRRDPSGHRDLGAVFPHLVLIEADGGGAAVGAVEPVGEGRHAHRLQRRAALPPGFLDEGALLDHAAVPPKRLR